MAGAAALLEEHELPVAEAQRGQVAVAGGVEEVEAWTLVDPTGQIVQLVEAVDVHPVVAPVELVPLPQLRSDIGLAGRGEEGHADRPTTSGWAKHDRPGWKYQPWSAPTRWFPSPTGATASTPLRAPKPPRQHG